MSLVALIMIFFDVGFAHSPQTERQLISFYLVVLALGSLSIIMGYLFSTEKFPRKVKVFDSLILLLFVLLLLLKLDILLELLPWLGFLNKMGWLYLALVIYFVRESSYRKLNLSRERFNPAQLFIFSFLALILLGTALLMLPKATHNGISLIDAVFTATSAVCVTGLIVVDTETFFTPFGKTLILLMIQLGGLGIMTFASYFSYFFRGKSSYENQLMLQDMTNSDKIGEVFSVLKKIIVVTLGIEALGSMFIFFSLDKTSLSEIADPVFFSIFHSISAFCNAGFSTMTNGLFEEGLRFNYPFQLIIAGLLILGGIGFPILFNMVRYLEYRLKKQLSAFSNPSRAGYKPWVVTLNTRLVLTTTAILLVGGTVLIYFSEYRYTLAEHGAFGKVVTAFFTAATPRTAGFNSVDFSAMGVASLLLIFLLMWIGGSPGSTAGGIKTSTFAIAVLNALSIAKGKSRIELFKREVAGHSVRRAFAIMTFSLLMIGLSIVMIAFFDREMHLLEIAFESFSAYSTVGLTLGITAGLSTPSKFVLIVTMFVGRVSMLSIMIAMLRRVRAYNYRYPKEKILMN